VERKTRQFNQASWILETTGSSDAALLKADLDTELRWLFQDEKTYRQLLEWDRDPTLTDPLLKRELNVLIRAFKNNQIEKELLEKIAQKEAVLAQTYANFRPVLEGRALSENDLRDILKEERDPTLRKRAWEASKEIGTLLAPQILGLVELRNQAAKKLGYGDYFEMQLDLQEVDRPWLLETFEKVAVRSDAAYEKLVSEIETAQAREFDVRKEELGPWAWSDPFGQEDPLDAHELDRLVEGVDIVAASNEYYLQMGFDVKPILDRSDMQERPGKNQHAFCMNLDRKDDVRTLNNVRSSIKWLETVFHELGHAVYELGFSPELPWLLREPPHMIPTEAMALLAGRQAYQSDPKARESLRRRQLIFSRWVLTMTAFESELYRNPKQNLNRLWWQCIEKYQKIKAPPGREGKADWAAKYHIGLAPVYYFSYLLGELFASSIWMVTPHKGRGEKLLNSKEAGKFLQEKLFSPGNRWNWSELVRHVTGASLTPDAWLSEFASN
jgi:peptidyl-dipeptidase A